MSNQNEGERASPLSRAATLLHRGDQRLQTTEENDRVFLAARILDQGLRMARITDRVAQGLDDILHLALVGHVCEGALDRRYHVLDDGVHSAGGIALERPGRVLPQLREVLRPNSGGLDLTPQDLALLVVRRDVGLEDGRKLRRHVRPVAVKVIW